MSRRLVLQGGSDMLKWLKVSRRPGVGTGDGCGCGCKCGRRGVGLMNIPILL
jgi:hypothetical protein